MAQLIGAYDLAQALKDVGYPLPDECGTVELIMPPDGIFQLRYTVCLTPETLDKVGCALQLVGYRNDARNRRYIDFIEVTQLEFDAETQRRAYIDAGVAEGSLTPAEADRLKQQFHINRRHAKG